MHKLDPFTKKRLETFVEQFRGKTGQLPTLKNLQDNHFSVDTIKLAVKFKIIDEFYVTLSNGSVVKGYKLFADLG